MVLLHLIILQQLNETTAIIISCVRDENMQPLDLTQSFVAQSQKRCLKPGSMIPKLGPLTIMLLCLFNCNYNAMITSRK